MARIQLPGLTSAAGVDLEVSRTRLVVALPQKYRLEASLPFTVDEARGKAKFDKVCVCGTQVGGDRRLVVQVVETYALAFHLVTAMASH